MNSYTNISFVYNLERSELVFIDDSLGYLLKKEEADINPDFLFSLVHPDDTDYIREKFLQLIRGFPTDDIEFRIIIETQILWLRVTPFLLGSVKETLIVTRVTDITADRNNIENIRKYANKKNSILNMLAHDLRGPLVIANTLTKTIEKKIDNAALAKLTRSISLILDQSVNLIVNLVDRELLDTIDVELSMERIDIARKVSEYLEECKLSESSTDREFRLSTSSESIYLEVDEAKFMQIMNNLVTNSLKFTHPGGIISMDIQEKPDSVLFKLSDNGIGIPQEYHDTLFDKFTNARRTGLNGEPTVGLGLSIVKMIVEWHKGSIWAESQENVGTSFFFEIPKSRTI